MKKLTVRDASLLAMIADRPALPKEQKRRIIGRLSPAARPIAEAMNGVPASSARAGRTAAARVATGVRKWSTSNKYAATARMQRRLK